MAFLNTFRVRLFVDQHVHRNRAGSLNLGFRTVTDKHRLAAPFDDDRFTNADSAEVYFDRCKRQRIRCRVHLVNERPSRHYGAYAGHTGSCHVKKVAPRGAIFSFDSLVDSAHLIFPDRNVMRKAISRLIPERSSTSAWWQIPAAQGRTAAHHKLDRRTAPAQRIGIGLVGRALRGKGLSSI